MHYVSVENIGKSFGINELFKQITFHISEGDKIALVAKNGAGKSTLLKILAGLDKPDEGTVWIHKDVTVAYLAQESVLMESASVLENIFSHDHPVLNLLRDYERSYGQQDGASEALQSLISKMDEANAWHFESQVRQILGKLQIDGFKNQIASTLSGGQRKRVALARTLIDAGFEHKHTLLILDEPTNHLDVDMVEWLEQYLSQQKVTLFLVTHDRYFLDHVCQEIIEIDDNKLHRYAGDYLDYLEQKQARHVAESASMDKARNLLRRELEWVRKQPRARTTKSKARVDAYHDLKERTGQAKKEDALEIQAKMSRLGGKVLELKKVYKSYGDLHIMKGFDYTFKRGERIGIIGRNGVGKSTFLRILLGQEEPDSGKVNAGDTVVFGHYSQEGLHIDKDQRVIEFVKDIAEYFPLQDGTKVTASQFLNQFLFPPEKQFTYLSRLSGGEKRRLHLLSILFRNPNFLILDEPTNDLDIQTLQVLEEFLEGFGGCVIIVSHDRYFMDKLVDHLFVFEGEGMISDFPGNYSQYRQSIKEKERQLQVQTEDNRQQLRGNSVKEGPEPSKKKLSYHEKREYESLQQDIQQLQIEKQELESRLGSEQLGFEDLQRISGRISEILKLIDDKEMRWLELDDIQNG